MAAILRGDYAPGQRLVEAELCAVFGASRATVREALRLLAGDGLIELEMHRTARVRRLSVAEAIEIAEVRVVVESFIARRAAERITRRQAAELIDIAAGMRQGVESFDRMAYSELNELLHRRIAEIAANDAASAVVRRLRTQLTSFNMRLSLFPGRPLATLVEHERLVEAIAAADPDQAEEAMRHHVGEMMEAIRSLETG